MIRFLYFPNNIYFGYDQARDAFAALEIAHGKLKLIGPTTSFEGLSHGAFYYYLISPAYLLGDKSPEVAAGYLRIINALGIFLIFLVASITFNKKVGFLSALLFAFSFEQSQFAIYMGNPAPASLTVMVLYLGWAIFIFGKKWWGLPLAFLGLGLSIQLQFALLYLVAPFALLIALNYKQILQLGIKKLSLAVLTFLLSISTFILADIRNNFRTINALMSLSNFNPHKTVFTILNSYFYTVSRMFTFNITGELPLKEAIIVIFLGLFIFLVFKKQYKEKLIFLAIWFFSIFLTFAIHGGTDNLQRDVPLYYPNVGVSISLLIFTSLLIYLLSFKTKIVAGILLVLILIANIKMVTTLNSLGTISEIDVQQGMLLSDEKRVVDLTYQQAEKQPFAVKAVTLPFFINTTWSYLYEWYGQKEYGYLPIWGGKNALGYAGNLEVIEVQEKLPTQRFLILEPTRGIPPHLINEYITEENYFTKILDERQIGSFIVQKRIKY